MLNALALRCRDPGEFIASVVEHHRGFPLPRNEGEKTYLVFVGAEGEEDILDRIPRPVEEFQEAQRWRDGDDKVGEYEEREERNQGIVEDHDEREADGSQSPAVKRARGIHQRIRIQWVETEGPNEDTDGTYDAEGRYREHNNNDDNQSSSEASEYGEFTEKPSPSFMTQQGRMAERRMVRELRLGSNTVHGYHADDEEEDREGKHDEVVDKEFVRRLSLLPSNMEERDEGMSDEVDGGSYRGSGFNKHNLSQELVQRPPQFGLLEGESDGKFDDLDDNRVEGRHNQIINDSQEDSDEIIQESQESRPNGLSDSNGQIRHPAANSNSNQTSYLPEAISQRPEPKSPILKPRGEIPPMRSPLSSPPPKPEHEGELFKSIMEEERQKISSKLEHENEGYAINTSVKEKPNEAVCEEREESVDVEEQGGRHAVNKISPQALSRRRFVLQIREPQSPVRPCHDEISPLTTPSDSLFIDADEDKPAEDEYPTEASEDEIPIYPTPTLENLVATENVDIIYLPDLETLHGFLEFVKSSSVVSAPNPPLLAIWGLVSAHYETEQYGGVGIGLTVARAVEAAARSGRLLVLGEGYIRVGYGDGDEEVQECWMDIDVPISNMGSMIAGRTVEIGQVLRRWCRFEEDLGYEDEGEAEGEKDGDGEESEVREYDENDESDESDDGEGDEGNYDEEGEDNAKEKGGHT